MRIAVGSDHVGLGLKREIAAHLEGLGHTVTDCGTDSGQRTDYPIYGERVARAVAQGACERGVLVCGTGVGMAIAANKVLGIRAVVCSEPYSARLSREHNDTNVLALGARVVGAGLAKLIVEEWLSAPFEAGRHQKRVDMLGGIERRQPGAACPPGPRDTV